MTEINYIKNAQGLIPATEEDWEKHNRFKLGALVKAKVSGTRNGGFHRKFFAMLDVGFEAWEPEEWLETKYGIPEKNRDQFRADIIIKAGYYEIVVRLDNSIRITPKSIKFGRMKQDEFEKLYSNVANVLLGSVLMNYTKEDLDNVVNQILGFV